MLLFESLFLTYIQQNLIKKPYALVYIQPSPEWGVHSRTCFVSYLEMICKKYSKKHTNFDIIIPEWIINDINDNTVFVDVMMSANTVCPDGSLQGDTPSCNLF